jgi:hypothetical protein
MLGKSSLLCFAIGVTTKAPLPLQIENERPHLPSTYLSDISTQAVAAEEIMEVAYAIGDNGDGVAAFTLGCGTESVTLKQTSYISTRF